MIFRNRRGVRRAMPLNSRGAWTLALFAAIALGLAWLGTPR